MRNKKLIILPVFALLLMLTLVVNLKPLYAAQGSAVDNFIPDDPNPIYDDLGQLSGISWDNDPLTEFNESGLYVVTINNILKDPFSSSSSFLNASNTNIYFPENRLPLVDASYSFIVNLSAEQTTLEINFLNEYGFSALKDTLTVEDINHMNISMRSYLGATDDLYTYTSKSHKRLLNMTSSNDGTDTLLQALENIGLYVNDGSTYPIDTHGEFSMELELLEESGLSYNGLTNSYENVFYNQISGPTTWNEANVGDQLVFESSWYDPLLEPFNPQTHKLTITLYETYNTVNPALRFMDTTYPLALSNDSIQLYTVDPTFNPQTAFTIADGDYFGSGNFLGDPLEYTFKSFSITKDGNSAIDYYFYTNDVYDASITYTGSDLNDYTFNFTLTTDFPPVMVYAEDKDGHVVDNEATINITNNIIKNVSFSYHDLITQLDNYVNFALEDESVVLPTISYKVFDENENEVSNTNWYNQVGSYSIAYTYSFTGINANDFNINYEVEVYENQAPVIDGPSSYKIPNDIDLFSESDLLSLYNVTDDIDPSDSLSITISTSEFDFTNDDYPIGQYKIELNSIDSYGELIVKEVTLEIYEPVIPSNTFNIIMSVSASLIIIAAGFYIYRKIVK